MQDASEVNEVSGRLDLGPATLFLRQWGDDTAPPVLLLHQLGIAGSSLHLAELGATLAGSYAVRALAPDLPGFGGSPPIPEPAAYRPDRLAALLVTLLDRLWLGRVAVVGLSWGATIACHLAALAPERVRALVLLGAGHIDASDQPGFDASATLQARVRAAARQLDGFRFKTADDALNAVSDDYPAWTPALEASWRAGLRYVDDRVRPRLRPEVYGAAVHGLAAVPPSTTWPAIALAGIPVLLLTADEPEAIRPLQAMARARFADAVPQADIRVARDQRQDLVAGIGAPLAGLIGEWLGSVDAT